MGGTPFGTTANRPSSPAVGQTYYNGELGYLEIYTSSGWIAATGANDFNLNLAGPYTSVTFTQSYSAGSYSIISNSSDATIDIYAFAADGSTAGYTSTKSFNATQRFNKMVIIGGTTGDVLSFSYKTTFATTNTTSEVTSGPFITSISPTVMAKQNDTITITGGNFATDVSVAFTGTGYSSTAAKSTVRTNSSQLIVTRPDNFPTSASPYTVTITNPGITSPASTAANISSNSITAGNAPVWSTGATLTSFSKNIAYSTTLVAIDSSDSGSTITYSFVSGTLPTGLSFNASTGVISGTPTSSANTTFTIRATDSGANYVDRLFTLSDTSPVWSTAAGALSTATVGSAYSTTLSATDDGTFSYSILSGSLPAGLSINTSTGVISGTPTVWSNGSASSFTVRATDDAGNTTDRAFTLYVAQVNTTTFTSSGSWTAPSGTSSISTLLIVGGGGGGSGGAGAGGSGGGGAAQYTNVSVTPGTTYSIVVGAGGSAGGWYVIGGNGVQSSAFGYTQNGGYPGGPADSGSTATPYLNGGNSGNGYTGGAGNNQTHSGAGIGGGGAGAAGNGGAYSGSTGGNGGSPFYSSLTTSYYGGGSGGGNYGSGASGSNPGGGAGTSTGTSNPSGITAGAANTGGGGGAQGYSNSGGPFVTGGSGVVVIRYLG